MYEGYAAFGGTELVNVARLAAYARHGLVPKGLRVEPKVGPYDDLPAALGHAPYTNVLLDEPPWYDATNPDSFDFAGLMPLGFTNLNGSTRSAAVIERLGDGGLPGRNRAEARVIAASVIAVGRTHAALEAGLAWLTGVLHPPCATDYEACAGAPVQLFVAPPLVSTSAVDEDAAPVVIALPEPGEDGYLYLYGPQYLSPVYDPICGEVTLTVVPIDSGPQEPDIFDALESEDEGDDIVDGGDVDPDPDIYDGGDVDPSAGCWVRFEFIGEDGVLYASTEAFFDPDDLPAEVTLTADELPCSWQVRITVLTDDNGADLSYLEASSVTVTHQPLLDVEDCITALRRYYRNVVTIDGPRVTDAYAYDDGEVYASKVEWTWVATDPFAYGDDLPLLEGLAVPGAGAPDYQAPGLSLAASATVTGASTACPYPGPDVELCGDDPGLPVLLAPPAAPAIADLGMPTVANYSRRAFQLAPSLVPAGAGALTLTVHNGATARAGVRIRLWVDDDPDFGVVDECAWEQEFYITYLPANQSVTIDGPDQQVWVTCTGGTTDDHLRNMRGPYGGPFVFPVLRCGARYHVTVDVPTGAAGVTVDASVTRRGA